MKLLNGFAKTQLYIDLNHPGRVIKPWSLFPSTIHLLFLTSVAIRVGLFTFGLQSEEAKFYLGVLALEYTGGVRIWTFIIGLMASSTILTYVICYQEVKKNNGNLLRTLMRTSITEDGTTLKRLVYCGTFFVIFTGATVILVDTIPIIIISINKMKDISWFMY